LQDMLDPIFRRLIERRMGVGPALILLEEFAREIGETIAEKVPRPERFITRVFDRKNVEIPRVFSPVDVNVAGRLRELAMVSPTSDFRLMVERDRRLEIDRSYTELAEISPYLTFIDAFQSNSLYVVRLGEMRWVNLFRIEIITPEAVRFNHIFARWEEAVLSTL